MSRLNELIYDSIDGPIGISLDRIRKLFHSAFKVFEAEGSPFQVGVEENCHWLVTGFEPSFYNQVNVYNGDPEVFEKSLERFYKLNLSHSVFLGGAGLAHAESLKSKGYINTLALPLMAYALDPIHDQHQLRDGLEVRRVLNEQDLIHAQSILSEVYETAPNFISSYCEPTLGVSESFRYCLFDNGIPVSTSHFIRIDNLLACWDVATSKEHQKKGYGEELMRWVMATHAVLGDELIVLQGSPAGQNLYRRLGFQFLEYLQRWQMEDLTRMRRFTHNHLQFDQYTLRPITELDAPWAVPYFNDQAILKWMNMGASFDEQKFLEDVNRWKNFQRNGVGIRWVIEEDGVPLGMIACHHTDWKLAKTEIGYMAFAPSRGKGLIPTIARQLTEFLVNEYQMQRVEIRTDIANDSSRRAAEKAGFLLEGTLRNNYLNEGNMTDDAIFAIIPSDLTR